MKLGKDQERRDEETRERAGGVWDKGRRWRDEGDNGRRWWDEMRDKGRGWRDERRRRRGGGEMGRDETMMVFQPGTA